MLTFVVLLCGFYSLQGASAQDINCTVTQRGYQTTYHLSESPPSHDCNYNWADINDTVLALKTDKPDSDSNRVVSFTPANLTIHGCLMRLKYSMDCIHTEVPVRKAYCETSCTAAREQKQDPCCSTEVVVGISFVLFVVFVVVIIIIICFCKDRIRRLYGRILEKAVERQPTPESSVCEPQPPRSCYIAVPVEEAHL